MRVTSATLVPRPRNALPEISGRTLQWFVWYCRRYLRRHFHSLRVTIDGQPPLTDLPVVLFSNHASWWDPLVVLVLKQHYYPDRNAYAPIDARMLSKYGIFKRLGFFGVDPGSPRGAANFLRVSEAVLASGSNLLALTPQGRFTDVRERPVLFQTGIGHLARRVNEALFVPAAAEFVFWEERLPEILVRFGEPVHVERPRAQAFPPEYWVETFEASLEAAQDDLARAAQRRNPVEFNTVLHGGAGQGGVYDLWRAAKGWWHGTSFQPKHGTK